MYSQKLVKLLQLLLEIEDREIGDSVYHAIEHLLEEIEKDGKLNENVYVALGIVAAKATNEMVAMYALSLMVKFQDFGSAAFLGIMAKIAHSEYPKVAEFASRSIVMTVTSKAANEKAYRLFLSKLADNKDEN